MLRHFALAGARWRLAVVGTVIILQPELARGTSEPGSRGSDARLACQAPAELRENGGAACAGIAPVRRLRGDLYAEANGWGRVSGEGQSSGLVPSVRVRAIWRLMSELYAHAYLFVKATRDRASATFSIRPQHHQPGSWRKRMSSSPHTLRKCRASPGGPQKNTSTSSGACSVRIADSSRRQSGCPMRVFVRRPVT